MASPDENRLLDEISHHAHELIKIIELERTGVRDGSGYWEGSDPLGGTVLRISERWQRYAQHQSDSFEEEQSREGAIPF